MKAHVAVKTSPSHRTLLMSLVESPAASSRGLIGWMLLLKSEEQSSSNRALRKHHTEVVMSVTTIYPPFPFLVFFKTSCDLPSLSLPRDVAFKVNAVVQGVNKAVR